MILQTTTYDPSEAEDRRKPSHVTRRDVFRAVAIIVILLAAFWPVYIKLKAARDGHVCKENLSQIAKGIALYSESNNDRMPPLYAEDAKYRPLVSKGRVNTWVSLIAPGVNKPEENFRCPAAQEDELVANAAPGGKTYLSSYGLFGAYASISVGDIDAPGTQIMVAETSNLGARGSYDPIPFVDDAGKKISDGFIIGLDNSNFTPDDNSLSQFGKSKYATRLAYFDTATGEFSADGEARHDTKIYALFADGHLEMLTPNMAAVQRLGAGGEISGRWRVPRISVR